MPIDMKKLKTEIYGEWKNDSDCKYGPNEMLSKYQNMMNKSGATISMLDGFCPPEIVKSVARAPFLKSSEV